MVHVNGGVFQEEGHDGVPWVQFVDDGDCEHVDGDGVVDVRVDDEMDGNATARVDGDNDAGCGADGNAHEGHVGVDAMDEDRHAYCDCGRHIGKECSSATAEGNGYAEDVDRSRKLQRVVLGEHSDVFADLDSSVGEKTAETEVVEKALILILVQSQERFLDYFVTVSAHYHALETLLDLDFHCPAYQNSD